MAAELSLAANIIAIIGFAIHLCNEGSEILNGGSTISVADCARESESLKAHCERIKRLEDAETQLEEAVGLHNPAGDDCCVQQDSWRGEQARIKTIAAETRKIVEDLADRLAKCKLPPGQQGWKRYRDGMVVFWNGKRLDVDAQMTKLASLRNELQSEILSSILKRVDLSAIRSSRDFQKLDEDLKASVQTLLHGQGSVQRAIEDLDCHGSD
jgi:chromosome segregation ATPase